MTFASRHATGALLALSMMGTANADTVLQEGLLRDLAPITFHLNASVGLTTFTGSTRPFPSSMTQPGYFALFSGSSIAATPLASSISSQTGSKTLTFSGLAAGTYTLQMVSQYIYTNGTYKISTSMNDGVFGLGPAAPVPEPDALVMALAGLVMLGMLGRRRRH